MVSVLLAKGAEGRDGEVHVVKVGPYELLSTNPVGEVLMATRAISDGMIFMRSIKHLIGIGEARCSVC